MKRLFLITVGILLFIQFGFSADLIDMGSSNQSSSTMGFEENEYDWMLNPADFNKLLSPTLFFSLDSSAGQFGANTVGDGFRGGYAWITDGFSPIFAANYRTNSNTDKETPEENIELDYGTYDAATGRYATIDESVDTSSTANPFHKLMFHFGGMLNGPVNFDLQTYWYMDRETGNETSYSNQYTDTAAVSDASLDTKGNLTETIWNLVNQDNVLAFEPEVGLNFGKIQSSIALGIGLYNLGASDDAWTQTVTSYGAGVDPTIMDQTVVNSNTGSYYYSGGVSSCFNMNTSIPSPVQKSYSNVQKTAINLDTDTTIKLAEDLELETPVYFNMALYPDLSTIDNTITTGYNDSTAAPLESSRTENTITTNLDVNHDINWGIGGTVKKTITPSDNSAFYLGAGTGFSMDMYSDTRNRTYSEHTQQDNDADGLYTTAVTDIDTTYTKSGWETQTQYNIYEITLSIPVAVSYSPVKPFTFHAGTSTSFKVKLTDFSTLTTGDSGYLYETYTDNLTAANSYDQRQKDGSSNINDPYSKISTDFVFSTSGSFGFTLDISDNFKVDAVANASSMEINSFSLTGIYSHK